MIVFMVIGVLQPMHDKMLVLASMSGVRNVDYVHDTHGMLACILRNREAQAMSSMSSWSN